MISVRVSAWARVGVKLRFGDLGSFRVRVGVRISDRVTAMVCVMVRLRCMARFRVGLD